MSTKHLALNFWLASRVAAALALAFAGAPALACDPTRVCCPVAGAGTPPCGASAGNPLNIMSGNKHQREDDMPALPGVLGLELVRYYNSELARPLATRGVLGRGWRLSYEADVALAPGAEAATLTEADGTQTTWYRVPGAPGAEPTVYRSAPGAGELRLRAGAAGRDFLLTRGDRSRWLFDAAGRLVQIQAASGEFVSIQRDAAGQVTMVTDPQGRRLVLHYLDRTTARAADRFRGVQHIDTPVGRFDYAYGSAAPAGLPDGFDRQWLLANLVRVSIPTHHDAGTPVHRAANRDVSSSSVVRHYHHEDPRHPTFLTGISVSGQGSDGRHAGLRLATWGYDAQGRATLSVRGEPARLEAPAAAGASARLAAGTGVEQVTLDFAGRRADGSGVTVLQNSLGQHTRYSYAVVAGRQQLVEVLGPGCASCIEGNWRWRHDKRGLPTRQTRLDDAGRAIATEVAEYDAMGRPLRVGAALHDAAGREGPIRWRARFEYGADATDSQPVLLARPSVVAGREHILRLSYNSAGQLTQAAESGYSPLNARGEPTRAFEEATPIQRTTRYSYRLVNGRSVLDAIDGPLPNGPREAPLDSDIVHIEHDARADQVVSMTLPGGFRSRLTHDAAGRIASVENDQGERTAFAYEALWLRQITQTGPGWTQARVRRQAHDLLGRLTEAHAGSTTEPNVSGAGDVRPQLRQEFDAADRLLWRAGALGLLRHHRWDTESRLLHTGHTSNRMAQSMDIARDPQGRPVHLQDNAGRQMAMAWNERGQLAAWRDPLGRAVQRAIATAQPQQGAAVRHWHDDFGRRVATDSPDAGLSVRSYDEADRLVAMRDALGHSARYVFDSAGRILEQQVQPHSAAEPALSTRWRYEGRRLLAVQHPTQDEQFEHDARGLRSARIVTVKTAQGASHTAVTRYEHDLAGELHATVLPDGSRIEHRRNGQGQVVAMTRHRVHTRWLRPLERERTLTDNFQRDLVGPSGYTTGNGIRARYERSGAGDLARVVYTRQGTGRTSGVQQAGWTAPGLLESLGGSTQDLIERLLGVMPAHAQALPRQGVESQAATTPATSGAPAPAQPEPLLGALSTPADPAAVLDYRYLWDVTGNLLLARRQQAGSATDTAYAYDAAGRLVIATAQPAPSNQAQPVSVEGRADLHSTHRYHHDRLGRRVLAQEDETAAAALKAPDATRQIAYEGASHRWTSERVPTGASVTAASYDAAGQPLRIGERRLHWDAYGRLTQLAGVGPPIADYRYDHRGLRNEKRLSGGPDTLYLHDESRQLLAEMDGQGRLKRQYVWAADIPLLVIDTPQGRAPAASEEGAWPRLWQDIGHVLASWTFGDGSESLAWLHTNHLGAPEAATDAQGQVIWRAGYAPFGSARTHSPGTGFVLNLRLPGQYEDAESGLHYNRQRYYDPQRGHYLSPDLLGTPDGPNPYAYVRHNPLAYVDPDGLVLFAFDGTGNSREMSDPAMAGNGLSNVVRFAREYDDKANGPIHYVSGVGTVHEDSKYGPIVPDTYAAGKMIDWLTPNTPLFYNDMGGNYSGPARIDRMVRYFQDQAIAAGHGAQMDIDIVGFSRGAAQAREFANRLVALAPGGAYRHIDRDPLTGRFETKCVNLNFRFMGLWDTVLTTNFSRTEYSLAIPGQFAHVAHAVALNEYRSDTWANWSLRNPKLYNQHMGSFPLQSIGASSSRRGQVRIELGFLGAHADIGGGYPDSENQLSQVALSWMVRQAQDALVKMNSFATAFTGNPVLHDQSNAVNLGDPRTTQNFGRMPPFEVVMAEDREVRGAVGGTSQRTMRFGAGSPRVRNAETHEFISYRPRDVNALGTGSALDPATMRNITGSVDLQSYVGWLRRNGYCFVGDTQGSCAGK